MTFFRLGCDLMRGFFPQFRNVWTDNLYLYRSFGSFSLVFLGGIFFCICIWKSVDFHNSSHFLGSFFFVMRVQRWDCVCVCAGWLWFSPAHDVIVCVGVGNVSLGFFFLL